MNKTLYILLIFFVNVQCSNEKKNNNKTQNRILYYYEMDSLVYQRNYTLTIKESDDYILYEYFYSLDSTKNMIFRFDKKFDKLQGGPFKYERELLKNLVIEEISKESFKSYTDNSGGFHTDNPKWFNSEYGLLNFGY